MREHLALRSDLELVDIALNRWEVRRLEVAALSRPLVEAARRGDEAASAILVEASEMGTSVATIRPADGVELRVAAAS